MTSQHVIKYDHSILTYANRTGTSNAAILDRLHFQPEAVSVAFEVEHAHELDHARLRVDVELVRSDVILRHHVIRHVMILEGVRLHLNDPGTKKTSLTDDVRTWHDKFDVTRALVASWCVFGDVSFVASFKELWVSFANSNVDRFRR